MRSLTKLNALLLIFFITAAVTPLLAGAEAIEELRDPKNNQTIFLAVRAPAPVATVIATATPRRTPVIRISSYAARTVGDRFLKIHARNFDIPRSTANLRATEIRGDDIAMNHVRYQHYYNGVPVYASSLKIHVDKFGKVTAANGRTARGLWVSTRPVVKVKEALQLSAAYFQEKYGVQGKARDAKLYIYSPALIGFKDTTTYLVQETNVSSPNGFKNEIHLIDARTGELRHSFDGEWGAVTRQVYDCSKNGDSGCSLDVLDAELNYTFGRSEGHPARGPNPLERYLDSQDTDLAYDLTGANYDYYKAKFNYNGANGYGGISSNGSGYPGFTITRTYTFKDDDPAQSNLCPYASYTISRWLNFCSSMIVPDVVGHEYAHAVFRYWVIGAPYSGETGALNEANSYIYGELFERWYYNRAEVEWIQYQEAPIYKASLRDPPSTVSSSRLGLQFADRLTSSLVYCGADDNGGVHQNALVPGKAAYLMSEGTGSNRFNGCSIAGIGPEKVERIWRRVVDLNYSSSVNFAEAYYDTIHACEELAASGAGIPTIVSSDCVTVRRALQAVEMDQAGKCSGLPSSLPSCVDVEDW